MSLAKVRESFPHEVTPTHYEVRGDTYPSYASFHGTPIGVGPATEVVYGHHDNLLDALRHQARIEIERLNSPSGYTAPSGSDDQYTTVLGPAPYPPHPTTPHVYAVYPDNSYWDIDFPTYSHAPDGQYVRSYHNTDEEDPYPDIRSHGHLHSVQANGAPHQNLIAALTRVGRSAFPVYLSEVAHEARNTALREHDPTAALVAADAIEEAGHTDAAQTIRDMIRDSGVMHYKVERYYKALKKLWQITAKS